MKNTILKRLFTAAIAGVMAMSLVPAAALQATAATTDSTIIELSEDGIKNATLYQYAIRHFDTNKDGKLSVGEAKAVTTINIVGQKLTSVRGIDYFENLESLTIQNCQLSSVHSDIGNLPKLKTLNLSYNKISKLPSSVGNLTNLVSVDLSGNKKLTALPTAAKNWKKITSLDLSYNAFKQIPVGSIPYMKTLKTLNLSNNSMANNTSTLVSKLDKIKSLTKLEVLDLSHNKLTKFPSTPISAMTKLKELYLNDNQLTSIPTEIGKCTALKILDASNNKITSLSSSIKKCTKLTKMNLANNKLSTIPSLKALTKLKCTGTDYYALNLCGNKLSQTTIRSKTYSGLSDAWVKRQTKKTFVPITDIEAKTTYTVADIAIDLSSYYEIVPSNATYQKVKYEVVNTSDGLKASLSGSYLTVTETKEVSFGYVFVKVISLDGTGTEALIYVQVL